MDLVLGEAGIMFGDGSRQIPLQVLNGGILLGHCLLQVANLGVDLGQLDAHDLLWVLETPAR